ncbi:MAG: hypothetical protein IRZ16_18130 [Myxococcaceae bacterium]|nr:hypothetical protein [Myxococcaceae bacterium]
MNRGGTRDSALEISCIGSPAKAWVQHPAAVREDADPEQLPRALTPIEQATRARGRGPDHRPFASPERSTGTPDSRRGATDVRDDTPAPRARALPHGIRACTLVRAAPEGIPPATGTREVAADLRPFAPAQRNPGAPDWTRHTTDAREDSLAPRTRAVPHRISRAPVQVQNATDICGLTPGLRGGASPHHVPSAPAGIQHTTVAREATPAFNAYSPQRQRPVAPPATLRSARALFVSVVASVVALVAAPAAGASRGQYGGTLRVALTGELGQTDPLLSDTPTDATLLSLTTRAVCALDREHRPVPTLALALDRESPTRVRLTLRPGLRTSDGVALTAQQVAQAWMRASQLESRSPYRALLFPLRGEGRYLSPASTLSLSLALAFPWPDLEASLCHPALAIAPSDPHHLPGPGLGPFTPTRAIGIDVANWGYPGGRPYAERLFATAGDQRTAARTLALGEADVGLGVTADGLEAVPPAPALFATYLAFQPGRTGPGFRDHLERLVDRGDLVRIFVRAPSVPMSSLLPPALMTQQPAPHGVSRTPPPGRELTLLYDAAIADQRAVAERLQVKLHDAGYQVALKAVSRTTLRARWADGDFDLMLHALLLPPLPAPALAVVIDAAGRHDLLAKELPAIGAITHDADRDARVRERARALQPQLAFIPLYAQSLEVVRRPEVLGIEADAFGLPQLDGAFFASPPEAK